MNHMKFAGRALATLLCFVDPVFASPKRDVGWLESAVLLKQRGAWRILFFHSTRVPTP